MKCIPPRHRLKKVRTFSADAGYYNSIFDTMFNPKPNVAGGNSPEPSGVSEICHRDQENDDPNDSGKWLHRNDEYVRRRQPPLSPLQTEGSNGTVTNTGMQIHSPILNLHSQI